MSGLVPSLANIGASSVLWFVAFIIIGLVAWRGRGRYLSGTTLVLKKFRLNDAPSAQTVLEVTGRPSGLFGFLLSVLRLDSDYELTVTDSTVSIQASSLSGLLHHYIPLRNVSSTACGYQRSILALIFAIFFTAGFVINFLTGVFENNRNNVGSDMVAAFLFIVLAAIATTIYFLSKKIGISIETTGGNYRGLVFKRSVIENLAVALPQAPRGGAAGNARVLAAPGMHIPPGPPQSSTPEPGDQGPCPQCSTVNPLGSRFCESCGIALS